MAFIAQWGRLTPWMWPTFSRKTISAKGFPGAALPGSSADGPEAWGGRLVRVEFAGVRARAMGVQCDAARGGRSELEAAVGVNDANFEVFDEGFEAGDQLLPLV